MENQTPTPKYVEMKEYLKNILKTAKRLGLNVTPNGGYTMGYDMVNLPPYPVGLFGALSIIEGPGARCKLGLSFDETESLEAGFKGHAPRFKHKNFKINKELMHIGFELRQLLPGARLRRTQWEGFDPVTPVAAPAPAMPATPAGGLVIGNAEPPSPEPAVAYNVGDYFEPHKKKATPLADALNKKAQEQEYQKKLVEAIQLGQQQDKIEKATKKTAAAKKKAHKKKVNAEKYVEKEALWAELAKGLEAKVAQPATAEHETPAVDPIFEEELNKALDKAEAELAAAELLGPNFLQIDAMMAANKVVKIQDEPAYYKDNYLDEWYPEQEEAEAKKTLKLPHSLDFIKINLDVEAPAPKIHNPIGEQDL